MKKSLKDISTYMVSRYSGRYHELGKDIRTLGWGSVEQQKYRFKETVELFDTSSKKSFLDIGCGFGDYLHTLIDHGIPFSSYTGWDITLEFIREAETNWSKSSAGISFFERDIAVLDELEPVADYVVMLGLLNLNLGDVDDNYTYSQKLIQKAFQCAKETLIVDFLSDRTTKDYPKEDFVFYHNPLKMLEYAFSLTENVVLKHDYLPIPQKEFMLILYK